VSCIRRLTCRTLNACSHAIAAALVFAASPLPAQPGPDASVSGWFAALDSTLAAATKDPELTSASQTKLSQLVKQHPQVVSALLVSSKGKVTAEAVSSGKPGKKGRSVTGQTWFETAAGKREPHHGAIQSAKAPLALFWALPVAGDIGAAGALAIKIDAGAAMAAATEHLTGPVKLVSGSTVLYSRDWSDAGNYAELAITIPGLENVVLRCDKALLPAPAPEATPAAEAAPSAQTLPQHALADPKAAKTVTTVILIAVGVAVFLLVVLALVLVRSRKRKDIALGDGDNAAPVRKHTTTSQPAVARPAQPGTGHYAAQQGGGLQPMQPPPAHAATAQQPAQRATPPTERFNLPPGARPPVTGQASMGPIHATRPDTATVVSLTPVVSPDLYETMKSQLTREITENLRQEFEQERKRITAKADVYTRTVQGHMNELTEKLSAAEGALTEMANALKNIAFKVKQASNGLEGGPGKQ
jgi:hypothetical protein